MDRCGFGKMAYGKVIERIVNSNLGYIIVCDNIELIDGIDENYHKILDLAISYIQNENSKKYAYELLDSVIRTNYLKIPDIINYLERVNKVNVIILKENMNGEN